MEFLKRVGDALLLLVRSLFDPLSLFKPLPASVSTRHPVRSVLHRSVPTHVSASERYQAIPG